MENDTVTLSPYEASMIERLKEYVPFDEEGYFDLTLSSGERILIVPCGAERQGRALVKKADAGTAEPTEVSLEEALSMYGDRWLVMHQKDFAVFSAGAMCFDARSIH